MSERNIAIEFAWSIGHGGQADVYLARRSDTGSWLAAKVLREAWDPYQRRAFVQEAHRQLRCAGPGVVPIIGWNLDAPQPFILVPYMPKGTLRDCIAAHASRQSVARLPAEQALRMARQIAESLAHIHQRNVVHRDLKPENILVDTDGRCIINDFGLAATMVHDAWLHTTGFLGTPQYAAPEQFEGVHVTASDIWALGLILHEMLTGYSLSRAWAQYPQLIAWPSGFHGGNQKLDNLVRRLAQPDWRHRPSARETIQLIDVELLRLSFQTIRRQHLDQSLANAYLYGQQLRLARRRRLYP